jgi:MscS family membrane protein
MPRRTLVPPLLLALALLVSARPAAAEAEAEQAVPAESTRPAIEDQVQGTCRTPREAMLQLLYWIQDTVGRVDPARAAECFDRGALTADAIAERARQLKRTLDARGLYIDVDAIPANADHTGTDGIHRWRLPELEAVEIVKHGDRWVFSAATVKAVPALHEETIPPLIDRVVENLPDVFHEQLLGIAIWQLCALLLFIMTALTLQKVVVFVLGTYVRRLAGRFGAAWVDQAVGRIARPVGGLVMAGVFAVVGPWLQISVRVSHVIQLATTALAAFSSVWLAYRLIDVLTDWLVVRAAGTASKLDDQLVPLLRKTLKVFVAAVGAIFLLQNLDVDVGSLLAGLGLGGLAFALAAKDTIANFFGSLVVFIDKPFQIGDWVVIAGTEGTVEEVGFRTTRVRTFYNSLVTIPNAKLTDTSIDNYGARRWRRYVANLGLTYDTPPERIAAFCEGVRGIIQRLDGMRRDYAIVEFNQYGESGLNVMVYCFMDASDWVTELRIRTNLNLEMLRLAADLGISFAFPTRTLHIDTQAAPKELAGRLPLDSAGLADVVARYGPRAEGDAGTRS